MTSELPEPANITVRLRTAAVWEGFTPKKL
jgi:hypothetical protein